MTKSPDPFEHLRRVIEKHGELTLEPADDPFARLVVSIANQQFSTLSAAAIRDRLFDRFPVEPRSMLEADTDALREVGLSGQKIEYVRNVAERFLADELTDEKFATMSDHAVIEELTDIRGVGVWTAKMFLM